MDVIENSTEKIVWSGLEYEEKERSQDWFWALGIIIVTGSIAAIIFGDYFFALLLVISGLLLGFFAVKKPEMVTYELNINGLKIQNRLYPYENIKSFWVQVGTLKETRPPYREILLKPTLFIHTDRIVMPVISVPIDETIAEDVHEIMTSQDIKEEEMREHPSEKIMEALGF